MSPVDFSVHNALTRWQSGPFSLAVVAVLIALAYWYLSADWALASRGRRWSVTRTAPFMAGLIAIDLALQSPVATFTGTYFQAHVVQHLLLMVVAPPLLALGAPSTLLLQTAQYRTKVRWLAMLRSRPFALLTHPIVVWALYFGVMFAFFLSSLINVAMHHMALMDVLNLTFLFGGCLYWWPMVGLDPIVHWKMGYGARMFNVLLGGPPEVILGLAILSAHAPIASMYTLSSTHAGGGLLWISTEFATIGGFIPIFWQWTKSDARAAARADAQADRIAAEADFGPAIPSDQTPADGAITTDPAPLTATASGASLKTLANDWADWKLSTWEAMWQAKAGRVPYSPAYSRQAIRKTPKTPPDQQGGPRPEPDPPASQSGTTEAGTD